MQIKKLMKKGILSLAVLGAIIPTMNVSALEQNNMSDSTSISKSINLENLSDDVTMSEVMTYEEIIQEMAKKENISIEEAKKIVDETAWMSYDELVKDISESENVSKEKAKKMISDANMKQSRDGSLVRANTYRTLGQSVTVTTSYKPTINWYCSTSESGSFHGIVKVLSTTLNRSYNGISKVFGGKVYTKLEHANKIHYILDGDFYNNGSASISGGGEVKIKEQGKLTFSLSWSSNHYKYCYKAGDRTW